MFLRFFWWLSGCQLLLDVDDDSDDYFVAVAGGVLFDFRLANDHVFRNKLYKILQCSYSCWVLCPEENHLDVTQVDY